MRLKRRTILFGLVGLGLPLIASSCANQAESTAPSAASPQASPAAGGAGTTVRFGYQKATDLDLLRSRGELDKRLQELGATVEWSLFPSGPPMLEAMNAGSIDFGGVGESPPIFSQAAGGQFYYVAAIALEPGTQDIVVPSSSAIQTPADLRGKKVALQKGSSAHYLLLQVLEEQGIPVNEVEIASLSPADARAAFEQGNVDAWSIWDPFLGVVQTAGNVRGLNVGRQRNTFFLTSQQFAAAQPNLLKVILEEAQRNGEWALQHTQEIAERFANDVNVDKSILEVVYKRRGWLVKPVDGTTEAAQQKVADAFYRSQIIPKSVQVKDTFLPAEEYRKIFSS